MTAIQAHHYQGQLHLTVQFFYATSDQPFVKIFKLLKFHTKKSIPILGVFKLQLQISPIDL